MASRIMNAVLAEGRQRRGLRTRWPDQVIELGKRTGIEENAS